MNSTHFRKLLSKSLQNRNLLSLQKSPFPASTPAAAAVVSQKRLFQFDSNGHTNERHGTTIICVRKNGQVCMMGDGMVSMGNMIIKPNAVKIRRILPKGTTVLPTTSDKDNGNAKSNMGTLVGFAGSTADAFTLLERLEGKLDEYPGQLARSCVELAKGWRTDKYLRRLEASLLVADKSVSLEITGNGDVLESHDGVLGVGSGSPYAIGTL